MNLKKAVGKDEFEKSCREPWNLKKAVGKDELEKSCREP